jgi:hypothetical protein
MISLRKLSEALGDLGCTGQFRPDPLSFTEIGERSLSVGGGVVKKAINGGAG